MDLKKFSSMYAVTIILLTFLAALASYTRQSFPIDLIIAVLTTSLLDLALQKFFLKKQISFPRSAIISGLIIGSVAPFSAPYFTIILAGILAMLSKFFIRMKNAHIFNPATFGLLISLAAFSVGDEWWGGENFLFAGYMIPVALILIISNYKAMKLKISLPFLAMFMILNIVAFGVSNYTSSPAILNYFSLFPFFFAFIMVSEPKTSPYGTRPQIVFGILVAILSFLLGFFGVNYTFLIALLIGNLSYFVYRNFSRK